MNRENYKKLYNFWLGTSLFLITCMVIIGGYTRLTGSGLSITEWSLISGILPPLSDTAWQEMFKLYKQIPQYIEVNFFMDLAGFKKIFWLEYIHRLLGRLIGLVIIIPAIYFYFSKFANKQDKYNSLLFTILVMLQGAIGWFMVSSGLSELTLVSHYRLALHLLTAFILYALIAIKFFNITKIKQSESFKKLFLTFYILLIFQIIYGAFVAGLHAGYIYNEFPLMGNNIYPKEIFFVSITEFFLTNIATIQFIHRVTAILLLVIAAILIYKGILKVVVGQALIVLLALQFLLGISALITIINIHLAVLHQLFALLLFTTSSIFLTRIKK